MSATFAYFSVTSTSNGETTVITGKTQSVGTFTMASPNASLYLGLTAADMAKEISASADKTYWATTTDNGEPLTTGNHAESEQNHIINTVTLNGGDKGVQYKCTAKFDISVTGLNGLDEQLKTEDGVLKLSTESQTEGVKVSIANDKTGSQSSETLEKNIDSLAKPDDAGNSFWLIYEFTATGNSDVANLKADFGITNRKDEEENDGNQNYLAGKSFTVTIKASNNDGEKLDCQIVQPASKKLKFIRY